MGFNFSIACVNTLIRVMADPADPVTSDVWVDDGLRMVRLGIEVSDVRLDFDVEAELHAGHLLDVGQPQLRPESREALVAVGILPDVGRSAAARDAIGRIEMTAAEAHMSTVADAIGAY